MSLLFNKLSRLVIGEGNGNPLQYSCPENPMHGGAWWAAVHVLLATGQSPGPTLLLLLLSHVSRVRLCVTP